MTHDLRALVVGGGWSGMAAAWYLRNSGYSVSVLDQADQPGGRSATAWLGTRPVSLGGKNIGSRYHRFRECARAMGVEDFEHFGINSSRIEGGRIITVDGQAKLRSAASYLRRTPPRDIWRFLRLVHLLRADEDSRYLGGPGFASLPEMALDRVFGSYLCNQLIRPVTVRMNGAEPDEVFLPTFGTNLGMLLDSYDQLRSGFDRLFAAFTEWVDWRPGHRVNRLIQADGAVTGVEVSATQGETDPYFADVVVLAVPACAAAGLVRSVSPQLAGLLAEILYLPAAVAVAEYSRPVFSSQVRGLVFPLDSPLSNAGAYGINDLNIVRYTFSGRAARPLLETSNGRDLLALGEERLRPYLPVAAADRLNVTTTRWPAAFCAYGKGHVARIRRVAELAVGVRGLALTGDYLQGTSIEACYRAAEACVTRLSRSPAGAGRR